MANTIPEFFRGQTVLVTGALGFMGKVLVEKILRACPGVSKIFVLVRGKKGKTAQERWDLCTELPLFDKLKSMSPESLKKVVVVSGDLMNDDLGLSEEDRKVLIEETSLVYHGAAMVQFGDIVTDAVLSNVKGTYNIANLGKHMKNLQAFVYISTAFSNFNRPPSEAVEEILPCCQDWRVILKLLDSEPHALNLLKEKLLCGHPNLYTWSKSISEQVIDSYKESFPVIVMRPGVVAGCYLEDPLVGWTDALTGSTAITSAACLGLLRVLYASPDSHLDYISVDLAARALLVATRKAIRKNERISVYNCTSAEQVKLETRLMFDVIDKVENYVSKNMVWPPHLEIYQSFFLYRINFFFKQILPAMFLDGLLKIAGKPTMFLRVCTKLANSTRIFKDFVLVRITFPRKRYLELEDEVNPEDKELFSLRVPDPVNIEELQCVQMISTFKYYFKEDLCDKNQLKKNQQRYHRLILARNIWIVFQHCVLAYLLSLAIF